MMAMHHITAVAKQSATPDSEVFRSRKLGLKPCCGKNTTRGVLITRSIMLQSTLNYIQFEVIPVPAGGSSD